MSQKSDEPQDNVVSLVRSGPGRPSKEEVEAAVALREPDEGRGEEIKAFIESDPLVHSIAVNTESPLRRLRRMERESAREAASIHFERIEAGKKKAGTSQLAMRRVEVLSRLATIELKIRELDQQAVSLSSDKMQKLFDFWTEQVIEAAKETMSEQQVKLFVNNLGNKTANWEQDAEAVLR